MPRTYPDRPFDRGKVLSREQLEAQGGTFKRYLDIDGDGIPNGEDDDIDGDGLENDEDDDDDGAAQDAVALAPDLAVEPAIERADEPAEGGHGMGNDAEQDPEIADDRLDEEGEQQDQGIVRADPANAEGAGGKHRQSMVWPGPEVNDELRTREELDHGA